MTEIVVQEKKNVPAVREPLDTMQRARWELAAMAGRLRTLEAKLVDERRRTEALRRERDRLRRGGLVTYLRNWLTPARPAAPPKINTPVHLYVVIGHEFEAVREFLATLQQRLLVNPDHRAVVMTDCSSFPALRDDVRHGHVLLEYLPDRATWERHRPDRSWEDVLAERLSHLYRDHGTVRTIIVDRAHPPTLAELLR